MVRETGVPQIVLCSVEWKLIGWMRIMICVTMPVYKLKFNIYSISFVCVCVYLYEFHIFLIEFIMLNA
jgi:hypothetical protein